MNPLVILFIVIPLIEVAVLLQVGALIGGWPTFFLILATAFIGARLVRSQGLQALQSAQVKLQNQQLPAQELLAGVCILIAGILLITPGILTDLLGFMLLIPAFRNNLGKSLATRFAQNIVTIHPGSAGFTHHSSMSGQNEDREPSQFDSFEAPKKPRDPNIIEGDFERKE